MEASERKKAGPITLAFGLIIIGSLLLAANVAGLGVMVAALKYWPVLLIGLGAEYFMRAFLNQKRYGQEAETRFHFPTVLVVLVITFVLFSGQQALSLLKNQDLDSLISEAVAGTKYSYQHKFKSGPISVKPGVTKVRIDERNGKIDLVPSADGKLYVEAEIMAWGPSDPEAKKRAEGVKLNINTGDVIDISRNPDFTGNFRRQPEVAVRVLIPAGVDVAIDNGYGSIRVDNISANLEVQSGSGSVKLTDINGNVSLDAENGELQCSGIKGSLDARLDNGNVIANDITEAVRINTGSGKIEVSSSVSVNNDYSIVSKSGDIFLRLPKASNVTINARTSSGNIQGTLEAKTESFGDANQSGSGDTKSDVRSAAGSTAKAVLGTGKAAVNLSSDHGNIFIEEN